MSEEKTQLFIWGAIVTVVTGIYGLFVKHIIGHADKKDVSEQLAKLWEEKQSVGRCDEIVKRIDENHKETSKKLDRIIDKLEKID